jgi:repressor LexA
MHHYFQVTPPTVHQMVLTLEQLGFISRIPDQARLIQVLLPPDQLPPLV